MKQCYKIILSIAVFELFLFTAPANAMNISARISDQHTEVIGGDRLYFEVEIKYPENPSRKDLRLEYRIIKNGEVIASQKVLRAIETQVSFLDYIIVPKSAKSGDYELNVIVKDYNNLNEEVSATFKVLKGRDQIVVYFFILLSMIILVAFLVIIQIITNKKSI